MLVYILQQCCRRGAAHLMPGQLPHKQPNGLSHSDEWCQERFLCLLQRRRERGSCSIKPSSTVPLDCPICLDINTHTHTHSLMHAHAPSVVLSVTHGKLHTQWGLSRRWCAFSDVFCEGGKCVVNCVCRFQTPFVEFSCMISVMLIHSSIRDIKIQDYSKRKM